MFTEYEKDKLLLSLAAMIARDRKNRGLKLNLPEAYSLISSVVMEWARDGFSVAELMNKGAEILYSEDCMTGIPEMLESVQIEATFPDGTKLVTIHHPIRPKNAMAETSFRPGQFFADDGELFGLSDREIIRLKVANKGDRPIQVGSHYHFYEVNTCLDFDRDKAYGMRLLIAPGTAIRFEPGLSYEVDLVSLGGSKEVYGFNAQVQGLLKGSKS